MTRQRKTQGWRLAMTITQPNGKRAVSRRGSDTDHRANLNTHTVASLYKTFSPKEAYRIAQQLEIHYTPKHGSWLDIAEIKLSALTKQCLLEIRIPDIDKLNNVLSAWHQKRNSTQKGVEWHFTAEDVRTKLLHLYPIIKC